MSDSKAKSGIGRRKEQTAAVYDQLHQYLRGGIEFLVPADEPSNISIEIASIIAVLDRSNERQNVDDAAGKAVAASEEFVETDPDQVAADEAAATGQREQLNRLRALEQQLKSAEVTIRERNNSIESLQGKLLEIEEAQSAEVVAPPELPIPGKRRQSRPDKRKRNLTTDERANAILAELEDSQNDIEARLSDQSKLSKVHITQLKQDLSLIKKTRMEIIERLKLEQHRNVS